MLSLEELKQKLQRPEHINANQLRVFRKLYSKLKAKSEGQYTKQKSNPQLSLKLK